MTVIDLVGEEHFSRTHTHQRGNIAVALAFSFVTIVHIVDVFVVASSHFALALANHVSCMSCSVGLGSFRLGVFDTCICFVSWHLLLPLSYC